MMACQIRWAGIRLVVACWGHKLGRLGHDTALWESWIVGGVRASRMRALCAVRRQRPRAVHTSVAHATTGGGASARTRRASDELTGQAMAFTLLD